MTFPAGVSFSGHPQLANGGKIAVRGYRESGGETVDGVYTGFAGGVSRLAEIGEPQEIEEIGECAISSNGTVGYWAQIRVPRTDGRPPDVSGRVFTGADITENIWNSNQHDGSIGINNHKEIIWGDSPSGLYLTRSSFGEAGGAILGRMAPGHFFQSENGRYIPRAMLNNESQVAFIYRPPGETLLEVRRGQMVPEQHNPEITILASGFQDIWSLGLDDSGRVVFGGRLPGGPAGIYAATGGGASPLAVAVDEGPGFHGFGTVAVSAGGQIAFESSYTAPDGRHRSGIFRGFNGLSDKIVADGDQVTIDGVVWSIGVGNFWPRCVDDSGLVLFGATLSPPDHDDDDGDAGPASVRPSSHVPSRSGLFLTMGTPDPPDDGPSGDDEEDDPENTYTWVNDAGGAFATAANWEPAQVPVRTSERADTARFNLGATYTVATPTAATDRLLVRGGDVTLNVGTYAVGGSDPSAPSVSITRSGILRVTGGALQSVNTAIGNGSVEVGQIAEAHLFNAGTTWTNPGRMTIGGLSRGRLFLANGPTLTTGEARLGVDAPGEAIVGGADSLWDAGSLAVGYAHAGSLIVESGGSTEAVLLHIGLPGGDGLVTVDGVGSGGEPSRLRVTESFANFFVGSAGGVGELQVIGGGHVEAVDGGFLAVGLRDGDSVGTGRVLVRGSHAGTGTRSTLDIVPLEPDLLGNLFVGWGGDGILRIEDGGLVRSDSGAVANQTDAVGVAVVDGRGGGHDSHWENAGELLVGLRGFGDLEITRGGVVSTGRLAAAGTAGSRGRITVDGVHTDATPSRLFVDGGLLSFAIGKDAGEGELIVSNGGLVEAEENGGFLAIGIGDSAGIGTGRVDVRGFDATSGVRSTLRLVPLEPELLGLLIVGHGGDGALRIEDGGLVQCESAVVSNAATAIGLVEVKSTGGGSASRWEIGATLDVGLRGPGQVLVEGGGIVETRAVIAGTQPGGHGTIVVRGVAADGAPSSLEFAGDTAFVIGSEGGSGELRIEGGARVSTLDGTGFDVRAGEVRIQGSDPISGSRSALFLDHADAGRGVLDLHEGSTLTVADGGAVRSRTARIGGLGSGIGAGLVVVEGTAALGPSRWHSSVELTVGAGLAPGSTGVLSVVDGGAVTVGAAEPEAYWVRIGAGGTLGGNGMIVAPGGLGAVGGVNNFAGTVALGTSPGTLTIEGDYTQGAAGVLDIEIGGLSAGFDHDQLVVIGDITLEPGATIRITFIDPNPDDAVAETFVPRTGDVFNFLVADTLALPAGTTLADVIEFTNLPTGVTLDFDTEVVDGATVITAATTAAPPATGWRITAHPRSALATAGAPTTLDIATEGATGAAYQWRRNGTDIAGATSASYTLPSPQVFHAGEEFSVVVTVDGAFVESRVATLAVAEPPPSDARLLNLSTRALGLTGDDIPIPGFVIAGTGTKRILLRAVGPTLTELEVPGVLENPRLRVVQAGSVVAANDDWEANANASEIASTAAAVGAFPLLAGSQDAALLLDLAPGAYTVPTEGAGGAIGITLVELYDADEEGDGNTARLVNMSNRGYAGTGDAVMIPGFVVSSEGSKTLLIRVVGPGLEALGVSGVMVDPVLTLHRVNPATGQPELLFGQDNWSESPAATTTAQAARVVGAFELAEGSLDAAFVVTLAPGVYTAVGSSADGAGVGIVLVEVYVVE